MQLKTVRLALYGAIVLIAFVGGAVYASKAYLGPSPQQASLIGGPFTLTDTNGKSVTEKDLLGHPSLVFFGYTFCPDVCPTTLTDTGEWLKSLGADGKKLQVYFITVDPERDTPGKLKEYLSVFDPSIKGLSGTPDEIKSVMKAYRVFARKVPQKDGSGDYLMDHSAAVYLMDTRGQFVGAITYQEPEDKAVAKLKELIARG